MADKTEKSKGGASKFFLGALLGGIAGAIAGKFIKFGPEDGGEEVPESCDHKNGKCDCKDCDHKEKPAKKPAEEKPATKK